MGYGLLLACLAFALAGCGGGGSKPSTETNVASDESAASASPTPSGKSWAGKTAAPAIPGGLTWFNVEQPLTLAQLKGKVVVLDFWTLGCINCQHIIPDLKRLEAEFGHALVVIGVHSGKYATEHDDDSVREAVKKYGLEHPIVNDPDFAVWKTFGANAWPFLVIIDPAGKLVGVHAGEGVYPLFQPVIASLVAEFEAKGQVNRTPVPSVADAVAPSTVLSYPAEVVADAATDRLYVADAGHNRILVSSLNGRLIQTIGTGVEGFADGGPAEAAFRQPQGLALALDGKRLFVADTRNHAVRAIDLTTYEVATIAGTGAQLDRLPQGEQPGRETALASPWDLAVWRDSLFIAMAGVHQLWRLDLRTNLIGPFAGTTREGIQDGDRRTEATLAQPSALAIEGAWLYWVDAESSALRRLPLDGAGNVDTLVGTGLFDYGADDGTGTKAKLQHPQGLAAANGRLFIGDTYNHKVRAYDPSTKAVSTLAGDDQRGYEDAAGAFAAFDEPAGLSAAAGLLYVADQNNHAIRTVDLTSGRVATVVFSNLSVAASQAAGRRSQVELPAVEVAAGVGAIKLRISSPEGYHLNSQGPSQAAFAVEREGVVAVSEAKVTWVSDDAAVSIPVPASFSVGATKVTVTLTVYYCRGGEEALCFIQHVDLVVPVRVTADSTTGDLIFRYELPKSEV